MRLQTINLAVADENEVLQNRMSLILKFLNQRKSTGGVQDETKLDPNVISILNLQSLKRGKMASSDPNEKLQIILSDIKRLHFWIKNYKCESPEVDSVKSRTFYEAGSRLKRELDHSDFDEGELRIKRRKAIKGVDEILKDFSAISNIQ